MKCIKKYFREKKPRVEVPADNTSPDLTRPNNGDKIFTIGIVIGHNKSAQGAYTYPMRDPETGRIRKFSEFEYNKPRGREAVSIVKSRIGVSCPVIFRPPGVSYSRQVDSVIEQCKELGLSHVLCLHINAAGSSARGTEMLIADSPSDIDNKMGDILSDLIEQKFGIVQRHGNGVKTIPENHNGAGMLYGLRDAGIHAVIVEPVFGNHRTPESERFFAAPEKYSEVLADVMIKVIEGDL